MRKSYSWLPLVAMSRASAPSGNDEAVFKKENSLAHDQPRKGVFVVLMIALLLLLGTISACITLFVEISKLKSEMSSLQMESASQQSLNALETELTQQLNSSVMSFNQQQSQSHNILDEKIELLNSSSQEQFTQLLELSGDAQQCSYS